MTRTRVAAVAGLLIALSLLTTTPATAATSVRLYTRMTGAQETPPNASPAMGDATVFLRADNMVCVVLRVSGIVTPVTGAHIHRGPVGVAGPIVVPLTAPVSGFSYSCRTVAADLAAQLRVDPSAFYVNVHSTRFPGGEIRGQLAAI